MSKLFHVKIKLFKIKKTISTIKLGKAKANNNFLPKKILQKFLDLLFYNYYMKIFI